MLPISPEKIVIRKPKLGHMTKLSTINVGVRIGVSEAVAMRLAENQDMMSDETKDRLAMAIAGEIVNRLDEVAEITIERRFDYENREDRHALTARFCISPSIEL
jgi:hypothetical protein